MSIQELERVIETLPRAEVEALREWIENYLEDQLEFIPEFQAKIDRAERELANVGYVTTNTVMPSCAKK